MKLQNNDHNLLRVLLLSQLLVYSIDEVETDAKYWQHDLKRTSKALSDLIIKKHGAHFKAIFEANGGELVTDLNGLIEGLLQNLCSMDISNWGAMNEVSQMILENPHVTLSEDEKDKLIDLMRGEVTKAANGIEEAEYKVDKLHTKISKMTAIGKQPYHVISSELIEIKRYLRKVRTGKYEGIEDEDQPRVGTEKVGEVRSSM